MELAEQMDKNLFEFNRNWHRTDLQIRALRKVKLLKIWALDYSRIKVVLT